MTSMIRPSTGTLRAAVRCGLGVALVVALATPSSAVAALEPHPEDPGNAGGAGGAGGRAGKAGKAVTGGVPSLSISIDNGRTAAEEGDRLTYAVTVRNTGATRVRDLELTQTLPTGLRFVSADGGGSASKGQVRWSADVPPGKDATFHTVAEVGATPEDLLRLASIACANTEGSDRPIVCATHSDQLPAGAAAAEAAHARAHPVSSRLGYVGLGAGAGLLVLALAGLLFVRRSRRGRHLRQPPS
ncbi:hypothetical protein AB0F88_07430 [Streptosporangium sp. NPDC023963]|uniref:hypothetical protein n=1 Tax=Streptosporangium sp. NPDC023963 TaxID=3155608 RepID=UPI00343B58B7